VLIYNITVLSSSSTHKHYTCIGSLVIMVSPLGADYLIPISNITTWIRASSAFKKRHLWRIYLQIMVR